MGLDRYFFVKHMTTGHYLHLSDGAERAERKETLPAAMGDGHGDKGGLGDGLSLQHQLVAATPRHHADVFGLQQVEPTYFQNLLYARSCNELLHSHSTAVREARDMGQIDLRVCRVFEELIIFVSESENLDATTREGIPIPDRQVLLREQGLLDSALDWVQAIIEATGRHGGRIFTQHDISGGKRQLHLTCTLSQRLCWHIMRQHLANRRYSMRFVGRLQSYLPYGILAANTLTEVFADNDELLDTVTDETVRSFLDLITKPNGRRERYMNFLIVLCKSRCKGVRANQWRVCSMLFEDPTYRRLLLTLKLSPLASPSEHGRGRQQTNQRSARSSIEGVSHEMGDTVTISGDAEFFPHLAGGASDGLLLREWLDRTSPETLHYFERYLELLAVLCMGRNRKNTSLIRSLLPYDLVLSIITDKDLHVNHLQISQRFVTLAHDVYLDAEPYEPMATVRTVRIWANVKRAADSHALSTRLTTSLNEKYPNWMERHNGLKRFILHFLGKYFKQTATDIKGNGMVLELLKGLFQLIYGGFYKADEISRDLCDPLIRLLDGREDRLTENGGPEVDLGGQPLRYQVKRQVASSTSIAWDTGAIMECKLWICKILQLICSVRLDIRLSQLLNRFRAEWQSGVWEAHGGPAHSPHAQGRGGMPHLPSMKQMRPTLGDNMKLPLIEMSSRDRGNSVVRENHSEWEPRPGNTSISPVAARSLAHRVQAHEEHEGGLGLSGADLWRAREECFDDVLRVLQLGSMDKSHHHHHHHRGLDLISILMDLTHYQHKELVSQAVRACRGQRSWNRARCESFPVPSCRWSQFPFWLTTLLPCLILLLVWPCTDWAPRSPVRAEEGAR